MSNKGKITGIKGLSAMVLGEPGVKAGILATVLISLLTTAVTISSLTWSWVLGGIVLNGTLIIGIELYKSIRRCQEGGDEVILVLSQLKRIAFVMAGSIVGVLPGVATGFVWNLFH